VAPTFNETGAITVVATAIVADASGNTCSSTPLASNTTQQLGVPTCGNVTVQTSQTLDGNSQTTRQVTYETWVAPSAGATLVSSFLDPPSLAYQVEVPPLPGASSYSLYVACAPPIAGTGPIDVQPGPHADTIRCRSGAIAAYVRSAGPDGVQIASSDAVAIVPDGITNIPLGPWAIAGEVGVTIHGASGDQLGFGVVAGPSDGRLGMTLGSGAVTSGSLTVGPFEAPASWMAAVEVTGDRRLLSSTASIPAMLEVTTSDLLPTITARLDRSSDPIAVVWSAAESTARLVTEASATIGWSKPGPAPPTGYSWTVHQPGDATRIEFPSGLTPVAGPNAWLVNAAIEAGDEPIARSSTYYPP
jgi:hypothetical protein